MTYYSQAGQDKWVHDLIGDKGFFVDVGAYDGVQTSNTYALELAGWTGICIEAERHAFDRCALARPKSLCVRNAVTDHDGVATFGTDRIVDGEGVGGQIVQCRTLDSILDWVHYCHGIDYLSMDIEGHELTVLNVFPFKKYNIKLLTIEHNLYCDGPEKKNALFELLTRNGFTRVREDVPCLDTNPLYFNQPYEDWYASNSFYNAKIK